VWLAVYPHHPTWEAARDEGSRSALVSEWHLHASHRVPPASIGPVCTQLAQNLCSGALPEAGAYQQSDHLLDEMWHYLKQKRRKVWIWKALDRDTGQLLDWECGRRDKATLGAMGCEGVLHRQMGHIRISHPAGHTGAEQSHDA
jgi:hypothetical protein